MKKTLKKNFEYIMKKIPLFSNQKQEILKQKSYSLSLLDEEYELSMKSTNSFIELKLNEKEKKSPYYYKERFDLQTMNKLLVKSFNKIEEIFNYYDNILMNKNAKLISFADKNIISLNIINNNKETNLELKQTELTICDVFYFFSNYLNEMNKKLENISKEKDELKKEIIILKDKNNKLKMDNEDINRIIIELRNKQNEKMSEMEKNMKLLLDEYKVKKEEEKKEKENERKNNDNVNLINDFQCFNKDSLKNEKKENFITNLKITYMKSIAVYNINRNNKILYEIAYPDNKNVYNIIIYDILNKKSYKKIEAHSNNIHKIKHYYYSLSKNHLLLTSSDDKSVKLWNISSFPISNIGTIENCFDGDQFSPFCLLFNKKDSLILGGSREKKKNIWTINGNLIKPIEKSNLEYGKFIESAYTNDKSYVLLSGSKHSECYDYNNNTIKTYKSNKYNNEHIIINLFKKIEILYLIIGDLDGNVLIFDFQSTNEIGAIKIGGWVYTLCSLNEKYFLAGGEKTVLKAIDFDNKCIVKECIINNSSIYGIEKIKIPEKGEYIIMG